METMAFLPYLDKVNETDFEPSSLRIIFLSFPKLFTLVTSIPWNKSRYLTRESIRESREFDDREFEIESSSNFFKKFAYSGTIFRCGWLAAR